MRILTLSTSHITHMYAQKHIYKYDNTHTLCNVSYTEHPFHTAHLSKHTHTHTHTYTHHTHTHSPGAWLGKTRASRSHIPNKSSGSGSSSSSSSATVQMCASMGVRVDLQ